MNTKITTIDVNGLIVTVARKPVKNWYLRVCPPDGRIQMTVPRFMPHDAVVQAIDLQLTWIKRQQQALMLQPLTPALQMLDGEQHYFQGQRYNLRIIEHPGRSKVIFRDNAYIELYACPQSDKITREKMLSRWYRSQLQALAPPLFEKWQQTIGVKMHDWRIKKMKTRWGTCNTQEKRIWLNLELIKKPIACLEYIIVHELVHLLERNHNHRFYAYMDQFLPQWRVIKKILET